MSEEVEVVKPIKNRDGFVTSWVTYSVSKELADSQLSKPEDKRNAHWRGVKLVSDHKKEEEARVSNALDNMSDEELEAMLVEKKAKSEKKLDALKKRKEGIDGK